MLDYADANGAIAALTSGVFLQVAFNVVFFVPLGFLIGHRWRTGFWRAALIGFGVSLVVETTQGSGVWGLFPCPYRVAEVDDLITNTTGAVLGWALAQVLNSRLPDPLPGRTPDPGPPDVVRRTTAALIDVLAFMVAVVGISTCVDLARHAVGVGETGSLEADGLAFAVVQIVVIAVLFVIPRLAGVSATGRGRTRSRAGSSVPQGTADWPTCAAGQGARALRTDPGRRPGLAGVRSRGPRGRSDPL